MATRHKTALIVVGTLVALSIVLSVAIPALVDVDRYRAQAIAYLEQETGKPVQIGRLALTLIPTLSIRADDLAIGNPAGFPEGQFVKAQRIYAQVDAHALWNRTIVIQSLELDDPVINLISDAHGRWNFENPPERATRAAKTAPAPAGTPANEGSLFTMGAIAKLKISGGQVSVANLLPGGRVASAFFEARGVSTTLQQFDFDSFTGSGLAPAGQGNLQADSLRFGAIEATHVRSQLRLAAKQIAFDGLGFDIDGGHSTGDALTFNFAGPNSHFAALAHLSGVDMARVLAAFPSGRGKMTGTLEGSAKLAGAIEHSEEPLAGIGGTGQLTVRNGQLPSLKLNRNLATLARLGDLGASSGDPSSFSQMAADFTLADQRIASRKITIVGNGVDAQGSGTLSLPGAGSLDYQGVANLAAGQNALTNVLVGLSGATYSNGKLSFPFRVGGTLENPKFSLQSKAGANALSNLAGSLTQPGQSQQNPTDLVDSITGLFKKKKPSQ